MKKITYLSFLLITLFFNSGYSQTLDQSQLVYTGGMSARTLPGYSFFQSFTAGLSGTLVRVDLGVFNYINGAGTLVIYAGSNNLGTVLQSIPVTVNCASGNCFSNFTTSVAVTAGQMYTFQFIPGAGIPDPYGVQVQMTGTYTGGQFGLIDPSGTYYNGFDLVFRTYVNTSLATEVSVQKSTTISPNPVVDSATIQTTESLSNATATLYNVYGQLVKQWNNLFGQSVTLNRDNLSNGLYILRLTQDNKEILTQKLVFSN